MKTRISQWLAGAVCLVAVAAAAPAAHAQGEYQLKAAFRAGQVLEARLTAGDEPTARRVIDLFVNAIHGYYENAAGEAAWVVWTPDMKQYLVATNQFGQIEGGNGFAFFGETTEGPLAGSKITGAVVQGNDQKLYVIMQVENRSLNVLWAQPLEPLRLQNGTGEGS
jgi:hypothetical protein